MKIQHISMYVRDLEAMRYFYEKYFSARSGNMYHNPKTGLRTYFLSLGGECRLELMNRPGVSEGNGPAMGYAHMAVSVGNKAMVDELTDRLREDGYKVLSGPRTTGDGYYESCVLDPEGNSVEITE